MIKLLNKIEVFIIFNKRIWIENFKEKINIKNIKI